MVGHLSYMVHLKLGTIWLFPIWIDAKKCVSFWKENSIFVSCVWEWYVTCTSQKCKRKENVCEKNLQKKVMFLLIICIYNNLVYFCIQIPWGASKHLWQEKRKRKDTCVMFVFFSLWYEDQNDSVTVCLEKQKKKKKQYHRVCRHKFVLFLRNHYHSVLLCLLVENFSVL